MECKFICRTIINNITLVFRPFKVMNGRRKMMISKRLRIPILLLCSFFTFACAYIVVPQDIVIPEKKG